MESCESVEDKERSGRPSTSKTQGNAEIVSNLIQQTGDWLLGKFLRIWTSLIVPFQTF